MSKDDLLNILDSSSTHTLYSNFIERIKSYQIINIYLVDNELIKIGSGGQIKKHDILSITPDYITIQYDSHVTDIMFSAIKKIEYFSGLND